MARPKKEKELKHTHRIYLRLTDAKYEIVADLPEAKKQIAEFGKIGSNLNQIARHFNSGGIHSQKMRKAINQNLARIYEMKYEFLKLAGDFSAIAGQYSKLSKGRRHGNPETYSEQKH